jgi:hypothetical protein
MPDILRKFLLAALMIAWGAAPAWSAGMPEYGTKNFTPGGDAPAYFTNEGGALGVAADFGTDQRTPAPAVRAESEPRHTAHASGQRHGTAAAGRHGTGRLASQAHGRGRSSHTAVAQAHGRRQTTHAHARGGSLHMASAKVERGATTRRSAASGRGTRSAKSGGAKPAKTGVRHAAAGPASRRG